MFSTGDIHKVCFEKEDWHSTGGGGRRSAPNGGLKEMLLRCTDKHGSAVPPQDLADDYYARNQAVPFDAAVVTMALEHAKQENIFPVSINIAPQSAHSPVFWSSISRALESVNPKDVVFELLEHNVDKHANLSILQQKKAEGYRFALDDITTDARSMDRLRFYGAIADFVKIDGKAVRHSLEENADPLTLLMSVIKSAAPQAEIIAEWVENKEEASRLKKSFGVHSVQGQNYAPVKKSQPLLPAPTAFPTLQYAP